MIGKPSIQPGVVVHMDPETLIAEGGSTTVPDAVRVKDVHYFLCLSRDEERATWVPCFTEDGPGRDDLAEKEKTGHAGWTSGTSYYHPEQVWDVPHEAAIEAARIGNDLSKPGFRNGVAEAALQRVRDKTGAA